MTEYENDRIICDVQLFFIWYDIITNYIANGIYIALPSTYEAVFIRLITAVQ